MARIKRMLAQPGAVEATLGYYRAALGSRHRDPTLAGLQERLDQPTPVPTMVACGSHDMRRELLPRQRDRFTGPYEWTVIEGAGHFLHREQPQAINRLVLDWLGRVDGSDRARSEPAPR